MDLWRLPGWGGWLGICPPNFHLISSNLQNASGVRWKIMGWLINVYKLSGIRVPIIKSF